jgi:hypothetical protein
MPFFLFTFSDPHTPEVVGVVAAFRDSGSMCDVLDRRHGAPPGVMPRIQDN